MLNVLLFISGVAVGIAVMILYIIVVLRNLPDIMEHDIA